MKAWMLIAVVLGGVGTGRLLAETGAVDAALAGQATEWVLYALLFLVGILTGSDRAALAALRRAGPRFLIVPVAIAVGSLLGGLVMAPLSGLGLGQSLAVAAGMGWYSLSGVLLAGMGFAQAGATAALANILRELIALVTIPLIARRLHPFQTLAPAGATATDVTLPVIVASAGTELGMLAVASGSLCSAMVPVLVPLLAGL